MTTFGLCGEAPLWDPALSWNTDRPILTRCFQATILTWVPELFIAACIPLQFWHARSSKLRANGDNGAVRPWSPYWTPWVAWKSLATAALQAANIILLIHALVYDGRLATAEIIGAIVEIVGLTIALLCLLGDRRLRRHTSGSQFIYWLLLLTAHTLRFYSALRGRENETKFNVILEGLMFAAAVAGFLPQLFADTYGRQRVDEHECPVTRASFLSLTTFAWLSPMMLRGYRKPLTEADLWTLMETDRTDYNVNEFERAWQEQVARSRASNGKIKPSAFKAAYQLVAGVFWSGMLFLILDVCFTFMGPQILKLLIGLVADPTDYKWKGFLYAFALLAIALLQAICQNYYYNNSAIAGMNLRSAVMATVYRKALRISNDARTQSTMGEMVNLISIDAQRFLDFFGLLYMFLGAPIIAVVAVFFLWNELGIAVLGGLGIILLLIPLNIVVGGMQRVYLTKQMKEKDQRIRIMSEILNGIKVLKLYAWEQAFTKRVLQYRSTEVRLLLRANYVQAFLNFFFQMTPFLIALASFALYVIISPSNILTAQKAFVSLALFQILRVPLGTIPFTVMFMIQFRISLNRVQRFLSSDELDPQAVKRAPLTAANADGMSVIMQDATLSWTKADQQSAAKNTSPILRDINLTIPQGKLVAVIGHVGSGKSSLCSAILGQMEKVNKNGLIEVRGSVAYVPQQAWIQNMTLKDNIIFSHPSRRGDAMAEQRAYERVLFACALQQDLEMMPAGDETEIGEKGMNLSGGQKQRVSLARATYSDTDIIILDDPLSAVDSHVAKHIFEHLLSNGRGLLQNKTRILVTHNISFLPKVDQIVVMQDGAITEVGTYHQLLDKGGAFADFLRTYLVEETAEGGDDAATKKTTKEAAAATGGVAVADAADAESDSTDDSESRQLKNEILTKIGADARKDDLSVKGRRRSSLRLRRQSHATASVKRADGVLDSTKKVTVPSIGASRQVRNQAGKLMTVEESATGSVSYGVYLSYFKYMRWDLTALIVVLYAIWNGLNIFSSIWISEWSNDAERYGAQANADQYRNYRLVGYGIIGLVQAVFVLISVFLVSYSTMRAAAKLHDFMLLRVMRAPMSFFDTTPTGRLLNRFSKDVDSVDQNVPASFRMMFTTFCVVVSMVITVCYSTPLFLIMVVPLGLLYYVAQRFYVCTSRQLRRLESVARSPIYSLFGESITGQAVIRAAQQEKRFTIENERRIDLTNVAYFPYIQSMRWLSLILNIVGALATFSAAIFALFARDSGIAPGLVGLAISNALAITGPLNWMVRQASELETNIVSAERITEYTRIAQEPPWYMPGETDDNNKKDDWPQSGQVEFVDYSTRYRPGLDLVLRGVSAEIEPSEKVGIVGRTGAGKSSLTLALFRIIEAAGGSIVIDGVDIAKIGLHKLRSRLTIIPQDPILFSGTLRFNLDPNEEYSDDAVWSALEHAHLKQWATTTGHQRLEFVVTEEGQNLSVGQRQLVCLARALLRKTKILVLDEATAAVDVETDELIQQSIRTEFEHSTVLTIAHRLNTILDYDRVMVLANGKVIEFDAPKVLLASLTSNSSNNNNNTGGKGESEFARLARDANLAPERLAALGIRTNRESSNRLLSSSPTKENTRANAISKNDAEENNHNVTNDDVNNTTNGEVLARSSSAISIGNIFDNVEDDDKTEVGKTK